MELRKIILTNNADKDLQKIQITIARRIIEKLRWYADQEDLRPFAVQLVGSKLAQYRFRVGSYRVSFDLEGNNIVVVRIAHRKEIYKK